MMLVKVDLAICIALPLVCLDSAGVWLSCQAIIWISVFVGFCKSGHNYSVFPTPMQIWINSYNRDFSAPDL